MPDVSLYTAAIAAAAAIAGATVPAVTIVIREGRQARRARQDRQADEKRQACLDLLRAAQQLRVKVANAAQYHGPEMAARLEEIRACEADVQLHAAQAALLTTEELGGLAESLADTADQLTTQAIDRTDMQAGEMPLKPDLHGLKQRIKDFRVAVISERRARTTGGPHGSGRP
jgi:hypothetical protein